MRDSDSFSEKKRIVILGGGFSGVYTAMHLEKLLTKKNPYEICIVNRDNYFVYQPMLAEVVGGSVGILDTVSALRRLIPKTKLYMREVEGIDLEKQQVILSPQFTHKTYSLSYDHLVLAMGNVTDFRGATGLHEHAFPFKNLADALKIRNHLIEVIEAAAYTTEEALKKELLTFVVGGGGFSGVEVVAEVNDFVRKLAKKYPIDPKEIRVVLIHSKDRLMERELSESLSLYSGKILQKKGVEILFNQRLDTATPHEAILDNGERIGSRTIISTVPSQPNPIIESLNLPLEKGKVKTDGTMQVEGKNNIWAVGDCAHIPLPENALCPPTAQFAIREAKVLAENIVASLQGKERKIFSFKAIGMLGALGHHNAVAEFFGKIKISGFMAWLVWRAIYWMKLPGFDRKLKVIFSWLLDMLIPIEAVQLKIAPSQGIAKLHFEPGEIIFHEGDIGDYLYIIVEGEVEVVKNEKIIAKLSKGEFFGEMALLNQRNRSATIRCSAPTDLLALRKNDFGVLIANFRQLKDHFETTGEQRK